MTNRNLPSKVALVVALLDMPAYALFGLRWPWSAPSGPAIQERPHTMIAGQKIRTIKLIQADPADLVPALQGYLNGIHSQGYILSDASNGGLIATDTPQNLDRLENLVKSMDRHYDAPEQGARQVLALRQMQRAIHNMPIEKAPTETENVASVFPGATAPSSEAAAPSSFHAEVPMGAVPIYIPPKEDISQYRHELIEERPALRAFQLVGWFRDEEGVIVVLRNTGQRYIYRRGRLTVGNLWSKSYVKGIHGMIEKDHLVLHDIDQGTVSLNMIPEHDRRQSIQ